MESSLNNGKSVVANDDIIEVIDLDCDLKPSEEVIKLWNQKIRKKILEFQEHEDDKSLDCVLEEYSRMLQEDTIVFEDKVLLKETILSHVELFSICYTYLPFKSSDTTRYFEHMEDILVYYCDLELSVAHNLRTRGYNVHSEVLQKMYPKVFKQIRLVLSTYLMNIQKHIYHVLIRITNDCKSKTTKKIMKNVYSHFLILSPQIDDSDEAFCRYYLILNKWKQMMNPNQFKSLENIMYHRFRRLEGSFQKALKRVFAPRLDPVSIISLISNQLNFAIKTYFNYIKNKEIEDDDSECNFVVDSDDEVQIINEELKNDSGSDSDDVVFVDSTLAEDISASNTNVEVKDNNAPTECSKFINDSPPSAKKKEMHTKETEEETSKTITPSDVVSSDLSSRSDSCASNNEQSNIENTNENIETHKENAINTTSVSIVETESPSVEKQTEAEKTQDESVVESNENLKAETCQRINTETLSAPSEVAAKDTDSKLQVSPESTATDENVAASVVCVTHEGMDATSDDNLTVTENLINEIECVTQDDTNLAQEFILMPGNDQELQLSNLQLVLLTDVEGQNLHGSLTIPEEEIMQSDEITENSVLQTYDESGTVHMSCNTDIVANAFNMADMGIDVRDIRAYERLNGDLVNSNVSEMASSNSLSKSQDSDAVLQDKKKHLHAKRSKNKSSHSPNGSVVSPVRTSGSDNSSGKINATSWMSDQTLTMPATSTPVRATSADDEHDLSGFSNGFPYYVGKEGQSCPAVQPSVPKAHFATKRLDGILKSSHKTDSKSVGNSVQEKSGTVVKSRTKRARLSDNTNEYVIPARTQTEKIKPMIYRSSLEVYGISEKDKNLRNKPNIYLTSALPDDMLQSYLVRIDKQKKYDAQNKSHKRERTKQKHHGYQEQQTTSVDDGVEPSEKRRRMELERMQEDVKRQLQDKRHESRIQKVIYKNSPNAVYPETSSRLQFKSQTGIVNTPKTHQEQKKRRNTGEQKGKSSSMETDRTGNMEVSHAKFENFMRRIKSGSDDT